MILSTRRLRLKSPHDVSPAEVCAYFMRNREFLQPFEPAHPDAFFTPEYQAELLNIQRAFWDKGAGYSLYITLGDQIIGTIALNNVIGGALQSCQLGYRLDKDHLGQGYMPEAVNRAVSLAFDALNLHRVEACIMPRNHASIAVVTKCGFEYEGLSRQYLNVNGRWEDHARYARVKAEA